MDLGLRDRVALIGGASQGLGRAAAEALAAEGAKVALVARRAEAVGEAAHAVAKAFGVETLAITADLAEPDACERAVRETVARFGRLDVLVANAGGPPAGFVDVLRRPHGRTDCGATRSARRNAPCNARPRSCSP